MKEEIEQIAKENYNNSEPWPDNDSWHENTHKIINDLVYSWLNYSNIINSTILNAGSGKTEYSLPKTNIIYMDIIEEYVKCFSNYIVGSIQKIPLLNESIDGVICVGSVINYTDALKSIREISRILKPGGFLILEFERSNSAEFLCTKKYFKNVFVQKYNYNHQTHYLWMYSDKYLKAILKKYGFTIIKDYKFHILSSLLFRIGIPEEKAAYYSKYDKKLQKISYPFAHNEIIYALKIA